MSLVDLARLIRRTGRIAEPAPAAGGDEPSAQGAEEMPLTAAPPTVGAGFFSAR